MTDMRHKAEAAGFHLVVGLFRLLGPRAAPALGGWLARTIGPRTSRHRMATQGLAQAMPDLAARERETVLDEMWDNLGRVFGEYPHLGRFTSLGASPDVEVEGRDVLARFAHPDAGALFVSGHFANWELMPLAVAQAGVEGAEVYRAPNNRAVDRWITAQRQRHIMARQVPKGAAGARALVKCVRSHVSLCMLADQKMNDGIESMFFGRPAMSPAAPATLALRYGVPIVPVSFERLGRTSRFRIRFEEPLAVVPSGDLAADVARVTGEINRFLEARIRDRPGQWLWLHRRWKD